MITALITWIIGLVLYTACHKRVAPLADIGKIAFFAGLLAWLLTGAKPL